MPATVLITEPFQTMIASHSMKLGSPGYHSLVVPHPVYGKDMDGLRALAASVAEIAWTQLTESRIPAGID